MTFDETLFIRALIERPSDAKAFSETFEPAWLHTVEYAPILTKIFEFTKEKDTPPSVATLRELFREEDDKAYEIRHKPLLDRLELLPYDQTLAIHTLTKAKNSAVSLSLENMFHSPLIQQCIEESDGPELMHQVQNWITKFSGSTEDTERRMEEAFEDLIKSRNWQADERHISCGIDIIDDWTGGGLSRRTLGLILAPTGQGKSTCLMLMAYKIALHGKRVMFISNELAMDELATRFGTLISGESLQDVASKPEIIRDSILKVKTYNLNNMLRLVEVNRDISTNDIESMISRYNNMYGWKPDAVVIDYMERMKPCTKGLKQTDTWTYYGGIASDLVRMAKRLNVLVWSAGQTNRSGYKSNLMQNLDQAQGSIRHLQEAAAVIAMRQRPEYPLENKDERVLEFTPLKMRHSKLPGDPVLVEANLGKMLITKKYHNKSDWTKTEDGSGLKLTVKSRDEREDDGI